MQAEQSAHFFPEQNAVHGQPLFLRLFPPNGGTLVGQCLAGASDNEQLSLQVASCGDVLSSLAWPHVHVCLKHSVHTLASGSIIRELFAGLYAKCCRAEGSLVTDSAKLFKLRLQKMARFPGHRPPRHSQGSEIFVLRGLPLPSARDR